MEYGKWIGSKRIIGNLNCSDPKSLFHHAIQKPSEFILKVSIFPFGFGAKKQTFSMSNEDSFNSLWKPLDFVYEPIDLGDDTSKDISTLCYEMRIPENLQIKGIQAIRIMTYHYSAEWKKPFEGHLKISPPGYFYQNAEVERTDIKSFGKLDFNLEHQVDNFLQVGHEACNPDLMYKRDECVLKQLLEVNHDFY